MSEPYPGSPPPPPSWPPAQPPSAPGWPAAPQYQPPVFAPRYASFGKRLGAAVIDALILSVPMTIVLVGALIPLVIIPASNCETTTNFDGTTSTDCSGSGGAIAVGVAIVGVLYLAAIVAQALYYVLPIARTGQTFGKRLMKIKVIDERTGGPIGRSRSFVRYLVLAFASGAVCYLGYLWMLWDARKRTWHDMAANSIVVDAD
ncbi:MAG: RDD family protein [Acidimicrobiales bacterium]